MLWVVLFLGGKGDGEGFFRFGFEGFFVTIFLINNFTIFIPTSISFCGTQDDKIEEIATCYFYL